MDCPRADPTIRSFVAPSLLVVWVGIKSYCAGLKEKKNQVLDDTSSVVHFLGIS